MNKPIFFLFTLLLSNTLFAQPGVKELFQKSYAYYKNLEGCSFSVTYKLKTAISTDTLTYNIAGFYERKDGKKMAKLRYQETDMLFNEDGTFFLYPNRKEFFHNNSKQNDPEERLKYIPYWMPEFIFKELPKKFFQQNTVVKPNDRNGYTINTLTQSEFFVIEMDSLNRISRFREIITDSKFGTQVKDYFFTEVKEANPVSLYDELKMAQTEYADVTKRKKVWKESKSLLNKTVNIDSLKILLGLSKNDNANLYFDFFYKDCLPCIQSIPKVNELHHTVGDSVLRVYGVDPQKEDEGDWSKFKSRYIMDYTIIDGEKARQIQIILLEGVHFGWPTNIVVSPLGKIIYVHEGYEKKLVKEIIKAIGAKP